MDIKLIKFIKKQLEKQIKECDFSINNIEKIIKYCEKFEKMILLFIVYNSNLYILFEEGDNRKKIIINIVKEYFYNKKRENKLTNTFLPFYICDSYFYHNNNIPIIIEAKPINKKGILIPPTPLYNIMIEQNEDFINYNQFINILNKKDCFNYINKKSIIYFKGANTGSDKYNIRSKLKEISKEYNDKKYKIIIDEKFIPMYKFCHYKYLLNLPGHQPWSYRLMNILKMGSLIIDIKVRQSYDNGKTFNEKWVMLYDNFFIKNKDFIEIYYDWIENKTQNTSVYNIYNKINKIFNYYEKNEDKFKKIVTSCKNKAELLNINTFNLSYHIILDRFTFEFNKKNNNKQINDFLIKIMDKYKINLKKI